MIDYKGVDFSKILKRYDVEAQNETTPEAVAKKMLPADPVLKNVAECVLYMKFKDVGPATTEALKTHKPLDIINNGLVVGMECVAKLYAEHIYYLPEIMMAAKTMEIGIAIAEKQIPGGREAKATVVMHAAEGDPHDIGKNIAAVMMRSAGYNVIDMGKDVAVTDAVAKCVEVKPPSIAEPCAGNLHLLVNYGHAIYTIGKSALVVLNFLVFIAVNGLSVFVHTHLLKVAAGMIHDFIPLLVGLCDIVGDNLGKVFTFLRTAVSSHTTH